MTENKTERAVFEADVIESHGAGVSLARDKHGNYKDPTVADHWETWQTAWEAALAAAALATQDKGKLTITKNERGQIVVVSMTDDEHRILKVIAESATQQPADQRTFFGTESFWPPND